MIRTDMASRIHAAIARNADAYVSDRIDYARFDRRAVRLHDLAARDASVREEVLTLLRRDLDAEAGRIARARAQEVGRG